MLRPARQATTVLRTRVSSPGSTGLTKCWSKPAAAACRRSRSWPQPVMATRHGGGLRQHGPQLAGRLEAVQAWHPQVEEHDLRPEGAGHLECRSTVVDGRARRGPVFRAATPGCRQRRRCRRRREHVGTATGSALSGDAAAGTLTRAASGSQHGEAAAGAQTGALGGRSVPPCSSTRPFTAPGRCRGRPAPGSPSGSPARTCRTPAAASRRSMPMPSSRTCTSTLAGLGAAPTARWRRRVGEYFEALLSRLANTCARRTGSPSR